MHVKAKNLTHDNTWRCPPGSELLIMPTCIISSKGGFQCTHALDIMPQCGEYPQSTGYHMHQRQRGSNITVHRYLLIMVEHHLSCMYHIWERHTAYMLKYSSECFKNNDAVAPD